MDRKGKVSTILYAVIFASILAMFIISFYTDLVGQYDPSKDVSLNNSFESISNASTVMANYSDTMFNQITADGKISILEIGGLLFNGGLAVVKTTFTALGIFFSILREGLMTLGLPGGIIGGLVAIVTLYIIYQMISAFMSRRDV